MLAWLRRQFRPTIYHEHTYPGLDEVKAEIGKMRDLITETRNDIMSALDDLKSALNDLASELADNNAEIEALLSKITTPGTSDADVAAAVQQIRGLIADNKAEVDKAKAATA